MRKIKKSVWLRIICITLPIIGIAFYSTCFANEFDYYGMPRPEDGVYDIGAIEYYENDSISYSPLVIYPVQNFGVNKTNFTSFSVSGVANAGEIINIYADGILIGTSTVLGDYTWSLNADFSAVNEGEVVLQANVDGQLSDQVQGMLTKTYNVNAPRNLRVTASSSQ